MKILLTDDHALFRAGLRLLLASIAPDVEIFEASNVGEALYLVQAHPDLRLCLLDLQLNQERGLPALRQIKAAAPGVAVVIVSGSEDHATVRACLEAGAMSYIPKSAPSEVFLQALLRVLAGEVFLPPGIGDGDPVSPPAAPAMTPRQREVLYALSRGLPTKLIARELSLSEYTVKEHIGEVFRILGVHSRAEAIIKASRFYLRRHD
jgi:DNA-binding NarL/FixJ family response regulator